MCSTCCSCALDQRKAPKTQSWTGQTYKTMNEYRLRQDNGNSKPEKVAVMSFVLTQKKFNLRTTEPNLIENKLQIISRLVNSLIKICLIKNIK